MMRDEQGRGGREGARRDEVDEEGEEGEEEDTRKCRWARRAPVNPRGSVRGRNTNLLHHPAAMARASLSE